MTFESLVKGVDPGWKRQYQDTLEVREHRTGYAHCSGIVLSKDDDPVPDEVLIACLDGWSQFNFGGRVFKIAVPDEWQDEFKQAWEVKVYTD